MSENHAHRNRPHPLAIEMIPTNAAAAAELTCEISCAIGAACEMIEIPAAVFKNNVNHNPYHCQVSSACRSVKASGAEPPAAEGLKPCGVYPSGGFLMTVAARARIMKYAIPRTTNVLETPTVAINLSAIGAVISAPAPNPATAMPVIRPRLSGNQPIRVASGTI